MIVWLSLTNSTPNRLDSNNNKIHENDEQCYDFLIAAESANDAKLSRHRRSMKQQYFQSVKMFFEWRRKKHLESNESKSNRV